MDKPSQWGWQLGRQEKGAQFLLGAPNPAGIRVQATAQVPEILEQAVGRMPFPIVPELLGRVEFRGIRRELFDMQPRVGLADRLDGTPPVNTGAIPEEDDMAPQLAQQRPEEVRHVDRFETAGLKTEVQTQVLPLRGHGESGQGGEAVMPIVVGDDRGLPHRRPGAAAGGHEQKAALIQKGEVGVESAGFF